MSERWCIIAGARSGSTWLEEMIFNSFPNKFYQMKLGEPLEHSEDYFKSSGHNHTVMLNPSGFIKLGRLENHMFKDQIEYVDYLIDIFNKGDTRQNLVLKVFPQVWKLPKEQYIRFLHTLEHLGFKFINLNRKITDRAISWQVMQQRKIVHKWNDYGSKFFSTIEGNTNIVEPKVNSIDLDIKIFYDYLNLTLAEDNVKDEILKNFNYVSVNYETMVSDCVSNDIPINRITKVQKLYASEYQELISNYDKIVDETNKLQFIEKYGKSSSLYNLLADRIKNSSIAGTICQYAWDYSIWMMSRKEFRNCCRTMTHKVETLDISKGKDFVKDFIPIIQLKKDLLSGVRNDDCRSCWNIENTGGKSPRSGFNNFAKFIKSVLWKDMDLTAIKTRILNLTEQDREDIINLNHTRMIEISLGNTCDLKCMYCHPHYSSQWAAEEIKHGELKYFQIEPELPKENDTEFETIWWDWFENHAGYTITCINFIGGEPLLINKFYRYIDRIINFYDTHETTQKSIDISIVSNFNTPPKQFEQFLNCVSRLAKHGKFIVDMNVSMEQISTRAEFVRTGTDWKLMNENIEKFLNFAYEVDSSNTSIVFNAQVALNALCISDLPEFFKFIIDLQRNYMRPINLRQNQISFPQWLSPYILPTPYTKYIDESIELIENEVIDHNKYSDYGRWDSYIHFLKGIRKGIDNPDKNNQARKEFIQNINKLSTRRNLSFVETFPEMIEFYNEINTL